MESIKGLSCSVYTNSNGDSTNDGLSSKKDSLIVVNAIGKSEKEIRKMNPKDFGSFNSPSTTENEPDFLVVYEKTFFGREKHLRAVPYSVIMSGEHFMFGGNFIYTSDSRFPSDSPIKIFDRVE